MSGEEEIGASERPRGKMLLIGLESDKEDALSKDEHGRDCTPGGSGSSDWSPMSLYKEELRSLQLGRLNFF